ncbi:MAG: ethanolamine ammonia-lyase subunit EutB, partial [Bradyrhizobium sp.]|nr:ethanolamine ammonia-lyase subunit EutB [Bradyrhizobium sp.]
GTLDGLLFGMGDAVIGINPATDNVEACIRLLSMLDDIRCKFEVPTQSCVLSHVTTSIQAIEQVAPLDLVFQSIAGTEAANAGFGVTLALLAEAQDAAQSLKRGTIGSNVMYFETGQGAALSAGQAQRVALARALYGKPFLIVLDEPNSNLDTEGDEALSRAVRSARARGAIVIVVAHRPIGIEAVDQVLVMKDGRMQAFGAKETVLAQVLQPRGAPPSPIKIVSEAGVAKS